MREQSSAVVMLSGRKFFFSCATIAALILFIGRIVPLSISLLALEVFATILGLFFFGSFRYQIHKNAVTYGMVLIIIATFCGLSSSQWHVEIAQRGWERWAQDNLFSFHGLDELIHADTMLFILGLTFFVAVIAQTRLLEGLTFFLLRRYRGAVLPTVLSVTAVVAFASGILDGVSMIGLTIRTLVIIMLLAAAPTAAIRYAVMVCTAVTTACAISGTSSSAERTPVASWRATDSPCRSRAMVPGGHRNTCSSFARVRSRGQLRPFSNAMRAPALMIPSAARLR